MERKEVDKHYDIVYNICLNVFNSMTDEEIKSMSWFGRNIK